MGALIMYNIQPGPLLFQEHPQLAWGLIASMFIGNLMLLILNMPFVKVFAKVIQTPAKYLIPYNYRLFRIRGLCRSRSNLRFTAALWDAGLPGSCLYEERLPFGATRARS